MAGFDTKEMMNRAIRYMAQTAMERAAGGWVPPKERERQQKEAMRAEEKQARQAEKQHKEAIRAHEKEQKLLSKQFPTQYMPNVGRQVMAKGGNVGGDTAKFKGRNFWSGVFDAHDGTIREVHPYKKAQAADFHHSYYVSAHLQDAMKNGDAGFFWVDKGGKVNTLWRDEEAPDHIVDAIHSQIDREGMSSGGTPDDRNQVGLYSKAARTVAALPQKKATGAQMVAALRDPKRGVKKEELINSGLMLPSGEAHPDWANRSVTADELAKHFRDQQPQIEEKVLGRQPTGYKHKTSDEWNEAVAQAELAGNWEEANRLQEAWEKSEAAPTKYHEWTLPGGENYREVLLKYNPEGNRLPEGHEIQKIEYDDGRVGYFAVTPTTRSRVYWNEDDAKKDLQSSIENLKDWREKKNGFISQHWSDPNVLAHIRMADRMGPNGEKILHVEELQSDWGQKGREEGFGVPPEEEELWQKTEKRMKEIRSREAQIIANELEGKPVDKRELQQLYIERQRLTPVYSALELKRDTAVPHGPYVTSTEGWTDLALKRVLKEAAEGGYDKIVFTPGEEQAKRYNLSAHVDRLAYDPEEKTLSYWKKGANAWTDHPEYVEPNKLHKVIGKEAAKQLLATEPNKLSGIHSMDTKDLVIGEEGMKAYYNQIVPSRLQDLVKKHDPNARVGVSQIGNIVPKNTELEQFSQSINFEQPAQPKAPIQFTGASLDVTPQLRESVMKGQEAYKRGGEVDGYADGGSPSLSQRILDYAETLPTAEENIETIKKFGRNVGEGAADIGKRVFSGFEKMAERALDRNPPPTVRAGERPVYVEPKREEPPQRLYVLPDGRRVSGAELEMHNEMMRERFEEQYAMPRVVQENMPPQNRPVPTRAPMREKLLRQEQQANVNRPVVLPERKGFDFPQVYKDIMSDEPQMEWTKGMTPREQAAPVKTAEGSIFASRGNDGSESNASGPLEVSVTKTITGPKDVYLGTGDTPNPFHSHQTMVASAPEYEGQVVPIPDTPADRMGEHHLPRLIWPIHELKNKEGYKAKQGLEDYNSPASAIGERFPTKEDVDFYRSVDATYGRPEAGYLQQGARGSFYDDLTNMTSRQGGYRRDMTPQESDAFNAAYIAAQRNPIAALGFRPEEFDFSGSPIPQTTAGMVSSPQSRIYADLKFPSVAVHEAIHRGLLEIRNEDYNAYLQKTGSLLQEMNDLAKQPYSSEKSKRFFKISEELDALRKQPTDPDIFPPGQIGDAEGKEDEQEMFVRSLMYKMFGPVEAYEMERQLVNGDVIKEYPQEKLERFMSDNADRIARLEQRAMKMLQERQRAAGPRARGGAVRGKYAFGGNPGDIAGGGFGTGNVGGGSSISSGGSMAEARAADRASVSGYSADSGGGSSWSGGGGGGGGRDSSPSRDRGTSGGDGGRDFSIGGPQGLTGAPAFGRPEQGTDTYNLDNRPPMTVGARFSPNIGADLVKEAVTPDFSTGNSPLASGVSSYDQNAINALYDRMRAEQQAERNESYERSVVGPTTPQINVPNAGDLYGATDALLAVNQKPSGMFGQPEFGTTRFGQNPMQSGFPKQSDIETRASGPFSQPNRPITPTPFSGYPQEVQNALNPIKPDSAFGQTLIDPTGKYTNQALDQMGVATDAVTMLNSPTLAGAFVRAFTPTPTPATAQQQAAIERMYRRDLNTGVPANFATPEGMAERYGAPGATPLARPGQTPTAYLSAGPSASTGRQDMPIGSTSVAPSQSANQTPRENFEQAFAAARARGEQTFPWTNPATGQTMLYTTQLGRKQGGRVPSLKEPEQWECKEKR